ncbi:MAG: Gfo/Idh/MocA family oxidoreductase [Clostridia bacterium]|nr:Gfo/Idh/MocA family oxidoreductase [Clostridia bacterium]
MTDKLRIAVIGCGPFAKRFVNLFKYHPNTEKVYVCDLIDEKAKKFSEMFGVDIIESFEEALEREDINCIANFTQRHLHGDISIRALEAGKHVYSAVPMASTVEECQRIVELVKKTGLTYFIGETCYYFPCAMYCREAFAEGKFGDFSYGAAQYYHHINDISYGKREAERGMPPLFYPTHSTAMLLAATGSYATEVVCFGRKDTAGDKCFTPEGNEWGNEYINQYVMMKLANGGTIRVTEARGLGFGSPSSSISGFYGTKGSYEYSVAQHLLIEKDLTAEKETIYTTNVSDYVNSAEMVAHKNDPDFIANVAAGKWKNDSFAAIQERERARLPKSYEGLENGHMASHQFLIDDFCKAVVSGEIPALNAWFAARCNIPGLVAIESCKMGGAVLPVPDCGDAPVR